MLGIAIDITEQKHFERELRASEERYRALLDNAVDAILIADAEGRLVDANKRAETLLGYSRDELKQMRALDLHPLEEHPFVIEVFQQLGKGGSTLVEHAVLCKDGTLLRVEVAATPISYGGQLVVQGIFRDVTERRHQEAERLRQERAHRNTLIREVHHRIKNNLQGVIGLLQRHVSAHPELKHPLAAVVTQVQSIAAVHGLQAQGEDTQMRLCDMVREITRNASMLAPGDSAPDLTIAMPQPVLVDKDEAVAVALIVNELLLNAMKHCPAGTDIAQVRIQVRRADGVAEVRVTNPGALAGGFRFRHQQRPRNRAGAGAFPAAHTGCEP